uniref:histone acetyltransferase n=1 Tax=Mucochytrium quahogii TaxID=96639 RepID=A0A7S2RYZ9_9STRA|mmetsp:Transcript_17385/g.29709  ORF Transcript_17385/g.29709 Transcript_17385/m.29709 type:complete len:505 (+) Transcript_17385:121-1635(+)
MDGANIERGESSELRCKKRNDRNSNDRRTSQQDVNQGVKQAETKEKVSASDILQNVLKKRKIEMHDCSQGNGVDKGAAMDILKAMLEKNPQVVAGLADDSEQSDTDGNVDRVIPDDFPQDYVMEATKCVQINLDGRENSINPVFAHQVFPRDRYIIGFKGLRIEFSYTKRWRVYVKIEFEDKLTKSEGATWTTDFLDSDLDKLIQKSGINPIYGKEESLTFDEKTFEAWKIADRSENPPSCEIWSNNNQGDALVQLYQFRTVNSTEESKVLLSRVQAMSLWWIETSEQTNAEDPRWKLYIAVVGGDTIAGFTSLFEFTNPMRGSSPHTWRVCQSMVVPFFQKRGIGREMMERLYSDAISDSQVFEVTVEDPCPEFVKMRDCIETYLCCKYIALPSPLQVYPEGLVPKYVAETIQSDLKLTLKQVQRCYEILRLSKLDESDEETFRRFRLDVKRRLFSDNVEDVQGKPKSELKANLSLLFESLHQEYRGVVSSLVSKSLNVLERI